MFCMANLPKVRERGNFELGLPLIFIEDRLIVQGFDPNISEACRAAMVLKEDRTDLGCQLLFPDLLEVIGCTVAERVVDGSRLFKGGVVLDELSIFVAG